MPYVLWLAWEGFYADEDLGEPQIVVRDRRVLDANAAARRRGVREGMGASEARSIAPEVVLKAWREEEYQARQAEWLDLCLPFCGRIEPLDAHLAALDLSDHLRPHEITEAVIAVLAAAVRLPLRAGAGPSKWVAALAARQGDLCRAATDPAGFLASLPVTDLALIDAEHRKRLRFLGHTRIRDVASIPLSVLRGQFGDAGLRVRQAALGTLGDPVAASYPPDAIHASLIFDGAVDSLLALEEGCESLARPLSESLAERNAVAKRVELTLFHDEGPHSEVRRTFGRPLATPRDLRSALGLMLMPPPERAVGRIAVRLPELKPARRVQLELGDGRSRDDAAESLRACVQNVRTAFGDEAVRQGSELTLPRWQRVRRAYRSALGWAWV